jgi:hypothetical protein
VIYAASAFTAGLIACVLIFPALAADVAPYAGQQGRTIKALSSEDVAALRKGEGMGMAKAAELNGYPARPCAHTTQLSLTDGQLQRAQLSYDRMSAAAKPLGRKIDCSGTGTRRPVRGAARHPARVAAAAIGQLQGRLQSVHLAAHLRDAGSSDPRTNCQLPDASRLR